MLTPYEALPQAMQNDAVRRYYDGLSARRGALTVKRLFDIVVSAGGLLVTSPLLLIAAAAVAVDSRGPVFFRQQRLTRDMRVFRIFKFRTMVEDADRRGPLVTLDGDRRVTRVGHFLRRTRIDELPQLLNVLAGDMTFVGTRPEVEKYVAGYSDEMLATLLLPAGITSRASIEFKDESALLDGASDPDMVYMNEILPQKMRYNLAYLQTFSLREDFRILFSTFSALAE